MCRLVPPPRWMLTPGLVQPAAPQPGMSRPALVCDHRAQFYSSQLLPGHRTVNTARSCHQHDVKTNNKTEYSVLVSLGMLLDETQAPMDFSRSSELTEFEGRPAEMDHMNARKSPVEEDHKGLDLSHSVLDRLSQKVMRCEDHGNCTFL